MEDKHKPIDQDGVLPQVEATLAALDHLERLEAGPGFRAEISARLAADPSGYGSLRATVWPRLRPVFLMLLVLANLLTLLVVLQRRPLVQGGASKSGLVVEDLLCPTLDEALFVGEGVE